MKTEIYYFSGTGNSLSVAQKLSGKLEQSKIISIPQVINNENITGDIIGIICPIYFLNMPHIVRDFILKIKDAKYVFMVYAGTGDLGTGVKATKKLFVAQNIKLSAIFNIPMPENSTIHTESEEIEQQKLNNVDKITDKIVKIVSKRGEYFDQMNTGNRNVTPFQTYIYPGIIQRLIYPTINKLDKKFKIDNNCIGCGTCQKVCQMKNISMKNNKPVWCKNGQCQACLACFNWCPKKAISHSSVNSEMDRYHNPNIKIKDIFSSSI